MWDGHSHEAAPIASKTSLIRFLSEIMLFFTISGYPTVEMEGNVLESLKSKAIWSRMERQFNSTSNN